MGPSILALLLAALPPGATPDWEKAELVGLFQRTEQVAGIEQVEARDAELARVIGAAYRLPPGAGESVDAYARRITKHREPGHPDVKQGQWLLAAARLFYTDSGARADGLGRLEVDARTRAFLENKAREAKGAAAQIGSMLLTQVQGGQGFMQPLARVPGLSGAPTTFGCEIIVRNGKIEVNGLERVTFVDDRPPPDAIRTAAGAIRELTTSQREWNLRAQTIGQIDPVLLKGLKLARIWAPGSLPALYVNEIMRGSREAGMKTVFLMVTDEATGKVRELALLPELPKAPAKRRGKQPDAQHVQCRDVESIQACARRLAAASANGPLVYDGTASDP